MPIQWGHDGGYEAGAPQPRRGPSPELAEAIMGLGLEVGGREELFADNPAGLHWKICHRVADEDEPPDWPALVARRITVPCDVCRETCWYDPTAAIYPEGEIIACIPCFTGDHPPLDAELAAWRPARTMQTIGRASGLPPMGIFRPGGTRLGTPFG